jgi:uncharacterized DUF497 family protein
MKSLDFGWNEDKNKRLKQERDLSFEAVVAAIENDQILDDFDHPARKGQRVLVVEIEGYVCAVPYVRDEHVMFLKTIFRNRDLNRKYKVMR